MYVFFNNNPKGLKIGDCVVRAISTALNQPWERTYIDLCIEGFMFSDMPNSNAIWASYLRSKGFKRSAIPDTCPDCYTLSQFAREHPEGSMTFIDDNAPYCYTKSMGMSQFDVPVFKRFKLTEEPPEAVHVVPEPVSDVPQVNLSDYITKAEFEPFKTLLKRIRKELYDNESVEQRKPTATASEPEGASSCNA